MVKRRYGNYKISHHEESYMNEDELRVVPWLAVHNEKDVQISVFTISDADGTLGIISYYLDQTAQCYNVLTVSSSAVLLIFIREMLEHDKCVKVSERHVSTPMRLEEHGYWEDYYSDGTYYLVSNDTAIKHSDNITNYVTECMGSAILYNPYRGLEFCYVEDGESKSMYADATEDSINQFSEYLVNKKISGIVKIDRTCKNYHELLNYITCFELSEIVKDQISGGFTIYLVQQPLLFLGAKPPKVNRRLSK